MDRFGLAANDWQGTIKNIWLRDIRITSVDPVVDMEGYRDNYPQYGYWDVEGDATARIVISCKRNSDCGESNEERIIAFDISVNSTNIQIPMNNYFWSDVPLIGPVKAIPHVFRVLSLAKLGRTIRSAVHNQYTDFVATVLCNVLPDLDNGTFSDRWGPWLNIR